MYTIIQKKQIGFEIPSVFWFLCSDVWINLLDCTLFLDDLKDLGFEFATKSGISIAINDIHIPDKKGEILDYFDIAYIPDYKTSVFMNSLFRNIKENINLDYLEESDDEEELCVKVMEHVYKNSKPKKDTTSIIDYVKGLNRTTINELIQIIMKKIHNDMSPDKSSIDIPKESSQNERDNKNMQIQPRQNGSFGNIAEHPSRQNTQFASTSFPGSNRDIMNNFEQMQKERNNSQPLKEMKGRNPQFEEQYREDNTNIPQDYEKALSERKKYIFSYLYLRKKVVHIFCGFFLLHISR